MNVLTRDIDDHQLNNLLSLEETHFVDLKSSGVSPSSLTKTISAFANTGGGEIYIGITEVEKIDVKERAWDGYIDQEAANAVFQVLEAMNPLGNHYEAEFITSSRSTGVVLHLTIFKTQKILIASNGDTYVRRGSQNLPVRGEDAIERLKYDKGLQTFENNIINNLDLKEISNSEVIINFLLDSTIETEPEIWLKKQRIAMDNRPTVAGVLLYSDAPQSILPKRSAVKILRYQTKGLGERDSLVFDPVTIEGAIYSLIYESVDQCKKIVEKIEKLGPNGLEKIVYPEEALHEILTNAILHRDYSIASDVQIRIFDNRVEVESPGKLPGHVTVKNITSSQLARNPQLVRLINKFRNPPNKDVGEGIRTAFEAMNKLRLKKPEIEERENSVVITLKHESLGSPEQLVMEYLELHDEITNAIGRDLTAIRSENTMKDVFYRLRDRGQIEPVPGKSGSRFSWRKIV